MFLVGFWMDKDEEGTKMIGVEARLVVVRGLQNGGVAMVGGPLLLPASVLHVLGGVIFEGWSI